MNLTWTGSNVTKVEATQEFFGFEQHINITSVTQYTFDKKKNPIRYFVGAMLGNSDVSNLYFNQNNILTGTSTVQGSVESFITEKYEYEYEDDYPVKVTSTTTDEDRTVFVDSYIYEY